MGTRTNYSSSTYTIRAFTAAVRRFGDEERG